MYILIILAYVCNVCVQLGSCQIPRIQRKKSAKLGFILQTERICESGEPPNKTPDRRRITSGDVSHSAPHDVSYWLQCVAHQFWSYTALREHTHTYIYIYTCHSLSTFQLWWFILTSSASPEHPELSQKPWEMEQSARMVSTKAGGQPKKNHQAVKTSPAHL